MKISFSENAWQTGELAYAYSYRFEETPVFVQSRTASKTGRIPVPPTASTTSPC